MVRMNMIIRVGDEHQAKIPEIIENYKENENFQ